MEEKKTSKWNSVDGKQNRRFNRYFTANSTGEIKCFFCNESEEHTATNGPKGTKLIKYFACKKFTEMTPSERYEELKKNCLCTFSAFSLGQ